MADDTEHKIAERAYQIWDEEGRLIGRDKEHWAQARRDLRLTDDLDAPPVQPQPTKSMDDGLVRQLGKRVTSRRKARRGRDRLKGTHLFAERETVELVQHRFVETFADAVGPRAPGFGARVIDVLDREIEFVFVPLRIAAVFVPLRIAAVFAAAVGQYPQQLDVMAIEEGDDPVVQ